MVRIFQKGSAASNKGSFIAYVRDYWLSIFIRCHKSIRCNVDSISVLCIDHFSNPLTALMWLKFDSTACLLNVVIADTIMVELNR